MTWQKQTKSIVMRRHGSTKLQFETQFLLPNSLYNIHIENSVHAHVTKYESIEDTRKVQKPTKLQTVKSKQLNYKTLNDTHKDSE